MGNVNNYEKISKDDNTVGTLLSIDVYNQNVIIPTTNGVKLDFNKDNIFIQHYTQVDRNILLNKPGFIKIDNTGEITPLNIGSYNIRKLMVINEDFFGYVDNPYTLYIQVEKDVSCHQKGNEKVFVLKKIE